MAEAGTQIFVRNREGKVFGPIEPSTVELLVEGGVLQGLLQVSLNGEDYALPHQFPEIRDFFPRHLWGDDGRGGLEVELDAEGGAASPQGAAGVNGPAPVPDRAAAPAAAAASRPSAVSPGPSVLSPPAVPATSGGIPASPSPPVLSAPSGAAAPSRPAPASPSPSGLSEPTAPATSGGIPASPSPPILSAPFSTAPSRSAPASPSPPVLSPEVAPIFQADALEASPFELAPPGPPRAPASLPAPLTSTFALLRADLTEKNALRIYAEGARANATGLFFFDLPDRTITLYMRRGNPESADSTHAEDGVGPFVLSQRLATAEQVARAEREALRFGNDVLAALFTLGFVNPGLVFPALAQRAAGLLVRAYLAPTGHFRFEALELPASKVVPLGNRWGLLAEVVRRVPLPELKSRLVDVRERPVVRRGTGDTVPDLRLTAQETRALGYFDGARSLANLSQSNGGEMDTILRVALLLREVEAVSFPEVPVRSPPPPPPARPAPPPAIPRAPPSISSPPPPSGLEPPTVPAAHPVPTPAPSRSPTLSGPRPPPVLNPARPVSVATTPPVRPTPTPRPNPATEIRNLESRLERMHKETAFQVLGVGEEADSATIKASYFKLAKLFHPDTVPPDAPAELARVKAEIFATIGEANRILADDASRARYRETLAQGGPAEVDLQNLFHAEETFHKGTALVRARRFTDAVKAFDNAITGNPKEGEFYAWRGYARFFTIQDKKVAAADAMRDLNQALKLNERCAPAHYFLGQIYKLTGDGASALKHFKKCVSIDQQHVDAQREIRLLVGK
jgi:DnaJ-domain-containing protein 1